MVQLILLAAKVAFLTTSYTVIITYLSGQLGVLVISLDAIPYWSEILKYITAAVATIRWLVSPNFFIFAMWCWLVVPFIKTGIYFSHMALTVGNLVPHSLHTYTDKDGETSFFYHNHRSR